MEHEEEEAKQSGETCDDAEAKATRGERNEAREHKKAARGEDKDEEAATRRNRGGRKRSRVR